ncbi:MAG: sigma-70 family RNA polymerase sigma factor [Ruminococcus sp.]|jgi:RNA polymerase sporulation-specific sigma factor|nr:sigma-70 family RNA polymerase sigma factor [Ruminococcus sp.]
MLNVSEMPSAEVSPTDEEIIASGGNAAEIICGRYVKYVTAICKSFSSPLSPQFDDFLQEAMIALFSAINTFDPSKGAKFKTYAYSCIRNKLLSTVKSYTPLTDGLEAVNAVDNASPETLFIQKESDRSVYDTFHGILSDLEFAVLSLRVDDCSYADIAGTLNITEKSVDNTLSRIRSKLAQTDCPPTPTD